MARLIWDKLGERIFETGFDRGVLYIPSQAPVPWNGFISFMEDAPENKSESLYLDSQKFRDIQRIGLFSGTLKAYTYPDEFLACEGILIKDGILLDGQKPQSFGLSYRTLIGNDTTGIDYGYKIHILYNLTVVPDTVSYVGDQKSVEPVNFAWNLSGIPVDAPGYRPTPHVIFDTRFLHPGFVIDLEAMLYGSDLSAPSLPTISELMAFATDWEPLWVRDNGDGTWIASDHGEYIDMVDPTNFIIDAPYAAYLNPITYRLSNKPPVPAVTFQVIDNGDGSWTATDTDGSFITILNDEAFSLANVTLIGENEYQITDGEL